MVGPRRRVGSSAGDMAPFAQGKRKSPHVVAEVGNACPAKDDPGITVCNS